MYVEFPNLSSLLPHFLPKLSRFCDAYRVKFCSLIPLWMTSCPAFKTFVCSHPTTNITVSKEENNHRSNIPPLFDDRAIFPDLKVLQLRLIGCGDKQGYHESLEGTSSSASSSVHCSQNLKYLFTSSFIQNHLKLEELWVESCEFLEEIVLTEEFTEEESMHMEFPSLNLLSLEDLPKLSRFCDGYRVKFCSLTELSIKKCPALKTFVRSHLTRDITVSQEENNHQSNNPPLFDNKVSIPSLGDMEIVGLTNLKRIWDSQLTEGSFCKLQKMRVYYCYNLQNVFPSNDLERFQTLKRLELRDCRSLMEIYQCQKLSDEETSSVREFDLEYLTMSGLKKVANIWSKDPQIFAFPKLRNVDVRDCEVLKYLFPASIAKGLLLLETLILDSCGIEEIVANAEGADSTPSFVFPHLTNLTLESLPNFRCFSPGTHTSEFSKLKNVTVHQCGKALEFVSEFSGIQGKYGEGQP